MIDTIAITDATPMTMPRAVRKLRNAWALIDAIAARAPSAAANHSVTRLGFWRMRRSRGGTLALIHAILYDAAVFQAHDALTVLGNVGLVRDDNDCLPIRVQLVEQRQDLDGRLRIEIARGL